MMSEISERMWTKAAVEVVRKQLSLIRRQNGGRLTAVAVLEDAQSPQSPIHRYFDWNDATAAHKHRLRQAASLIHVVKVEVMVGTKKRSVPNYVSVKHEGSREYKPLDEIRKNDELSEQVMARAKGMLEAWLKQYEALRVYFGGAFAHVERAVEQMKAKPVVSKKPVVIKKKRSRVSSLSGLV